MDGFLQQEGFEVPKCPSDRQERTQALLEAAEERILVLDGATGTAIQGFQLSASDFGGAAYEGCNEYLCRTRPDVVRGLAEHYLEAGADIVETNSFGSTPLVLAEYQLAHLSFELSRRSAELAREACRAFDAPGRLRFVCGSMGPTTKSLSVTGGVSFDELQGHFEIQALGLMAGGADYLLLETCQDTLNLKAGLLGIDRAFQRAGWELPVAVSITIEPSGTMLAGQDAEAVVVSLAHRPLFYLGLNCATGPQLMADSLRTLAELAKTRVACVPNAGLPDEEGRYPEGPEVFREVFTRYLQAGWLNLIGGCCGTTAAHIRVLAELSRGFRPRRIPVHHRAMVSGLEAVELTAENRPVLVGERTNVLGSRKFKELVARSAWEEAAELGRAQVRAGAQILDVCLQDPDRNEKEDLVQILAQLVRRVRVPIMLDSTDAEVLEAGLKLCQGKAILNSINLEEGTKRFEQVVPLARKYGAALVVGLIDERGMAVDRHRKLEVATRSHRILTEEFGVPEEDLWFDPLVFPCGSGDAAYWGSAAETIAAVEAISREFPNSRTILGISNVSFGLPPLAREVVNSVFLYHATRAGLSAAIVNTERLARYAEIAVRERELAEALLFVPYGDGAAGERAVAELTKFYRSLSREKVVKSERRELSVEERLIRAVVEGSKEHLVSDLEEALASGKYPTPLELINGPLMAGMNEVGRLFAANELIVAEVLQSAEVMKAAVSHLERKMARPAGGSRGKVLLATVKGDVHDIGKNLVEIVLANNGFEVIDLGIKVPSERLIEAYRSHRPDVIGLSGLLVRSAQQMVTTAEDLRAAGIAVPLIVGGAALTRKFTHRKIAPAYGAFCTYARDAMHGLQLVEALSDPTRREALVKEVLEAVARDRQEADPALDAAPARKVDPKVQRGLRPPSPPDFERHVAELSLDEVWGELNLQMLFGKHLGLRGAVARLKEAGDEKLRKLELLLAELQDLARQGAMRVHAVWQFFPARAVGERVDLLQPKNGQVVASWEFPRQRGSGGLCIADFVLEEDSVALFVTTAGVGVRQQVEEWKRQGEFLKAHAFAALALETAEAAAEWLHRKLREDWGIGDPPETTLADRLQARYRGRRYSFGYPACPDLAGQRELFRLLRPEEIGVRLTEGDMMDPEASVSALVLHHPDARYFGV